jgi:hypothetical protein
MVFSLVTSMGVVGILTLLVACSFEQATNPQSEDQAISGSVQEPSMTYDEQRDRAFSSDAEPSENPFGEVHSLYDMDDTYLRIALTSPLNAFSVDMRPLFKILTDLNGSKDLYFYNGSLNVSPLTPQGPLNQLLAGFDIQFSASGRVGNITFLLISSAIHTEDLDYTFIWLVGNNGYDLRDAQHQRYSADTLYLGREQLMRSLDAYIGNETTQKPPLASGKPDFNSTDYIPFAAMVDAYSGELFKSVVSQYAVGDPIAYHLTSAFMYASDLNNPTTNVTYLDCSGGGSREMDQSEIASVTDTSATSGSGQLHLNGYWYLTILPFYLDDEKDSGIQPVTTTIPTADENVTPEKHTYSANNIVVLCFPVDGNQ